MRKQVIMQISLLLVALVAGATDIDKTFLGLCATPGSDAMKVSEAIAAGASTAFTDFNNNTCLYFAAAMGNLEVVRVLLSADETMVHIGNTLAQQPLHVAVHAGHLDIARLLLSHGAQINAKMANGATPLDLASAGSNAQLTSMLAEWQAARRAENDDTEFAARDAAMTELTEALAAVVRSERWGANRAEGEEVADEMERLDWAIEVSREVGVEESIIKPIEAKYLGGEPMRHAVVTPEGMTELTE